MLLLALCIVALAAPQLAPHLPTEADLMRTLEHPSAAHWLGTDQYGRDVLSRPIWGARISIYVALSVVVLSLTLGSILGAVAGYAGGWLDRFLMVGNDIPHAGERVEASPHQLSGGMRQQVLIAMAIAFGPKVLIADEPTTALDVTVQAQILELQEELQADLGMGMVLFSHDLGLVATHADRVAVMYLGRIVEIGPRDAIYRAPAHPYTLSLLSAVPVPEASAARVRNRVVLHGEIGSATRLPEGCRFHPRCYLARLRAREGRVPTVEHEGDRLPEVCVRRDPEAIELAPGHEAACHFPEGVGGRSEVAERAMDFTSGG